MMINPAISAAFPVARSLLQSLKMTIAKLARVPIVGVIVVVRGLPQVPIIIVALSRRSFRIVGRASGERRPPTGERRMRNSSLRPGELRLRFEDYGGSEGSMVDDAGPAVELRDSWLVGRILGAVDGGFFGPVLPRLGEERPPAIASRPAPQTGGAPFLRYGCQPDSRLLETRARAG